MKKTIALLLTSWFWLSAASQQNLSSLFADTTAPAHIPVIATFKSVDVINGRSNETLKKHNLLFTVAHRFGDIAGKNGGGKTLFGMDDIYDVLIGFDYGISDKLTLGAGRDKGAPNGVNTDQSSLYYLSVKYRLWQQTTDNHIPFCVTLFARGLFSSMHRIDKPGSDADFQGFGDRTSAVAQLIVARKFSENFSLEISPTYLRRNLVSVLEMKDMFAMGIGARVRVSRHMAVVADYFIPLRSSESTDYYKQQFGQDFYNALGVGLEIETGGHVFHINFTNSTSIMETQFIPSTTTSWAKGQFRWGFNLSRTFLLGGKNQTVHR